MHGVIRSSVSARRAEGEAGSGSGETDGWTEVQSRHFAVLTPAGEKPAASWAVAMEQFAQALDAGVGLKQPALPPVTVVLFRHERDFEPYKPLERGRPARMGGFFVRADDINVIALSLDKDDADLRRTIQHEAVHWYFSARGRPLPVWLEEGLAEAYSTFHLADAAHGVFGEPIPAHLQLLRRRGLIPLEELVAIKKGSIHYDERIRTGIFYAESWLLAHYLIFGGIGGSGRGLDRYESFLDRGMDSVGAFRRSIGVGGADLMARLRQYLASQNFRQAVVAMDGAGIGGSLHARPARAGEVELALGSIMIATRTRAEAGERLRRAVELLPGEPRPWECLGQLDLAYRDPGQAARDYARAVDLGSANYRAYFDLAVARLGYRPDVLNEVSMGVTGDVRPSLDALQRSLSLAPGYLGAYRIFAWLIGSSPVATEGDRALLERGAALAPADILIAEGLGAAELKTGRAEQGKRRLERLIAAFPGEPTAYARAILQGDDLGRFYRRIDGFFAAGRYTDVSLAIAQFEASDPEGASTEWDKLQALKKKAEKLTAASP